MKSNGQELVGDIAPHPLKVGGRTLLIKRADDADSIAIRGEASKVLQRETPLGRLVNDPAFGKLPPACQLEATRAAAAMQARGPEELSAEELFKALTQPDLLAFAVLITAIDQHPGLTLEEVRKEITDRNAGAIFVAWVEACRLGKPLGNSAGPSGSTPAASGTAALSTAR